MEQILCKQNISVPSIPSYTFQAVELGKISAQTLLNYLQFK